MPSKKLFQVYRYFSADGDLLYVGSSLHAVARASQHRVSSEWYAQAARIEIENHPSRQRMLAAEKAAIIRERPRHNVAHARSCCLSDAELSISDDDFVMLWIFVREKGWSPDKVAARFGVRASAVLTLVDLLEIERADMLLAKRGELPMPWEDPDDESTWSLGTHVAKFEAEHGPVGDIPWIKRLTASRLSAMS